VLPRLSCEVSKNLGLRAPASMLSLFGRAGSLRSTSFLDPKLSSQVRHVHADSASRAVGNIIGL
jgi:hypothetical protein